MGTVREASGIRVEPVRPPMGRVDRSTFLDTFQETFGDDGRFGAGCAQRALGLVERIERDPAISDIRWAAYMLATVAWETTVLQTTERTVSDRRGRVLLDRKGQPVRVRQRRWMTNMEPVDEVGHGAGRRYHEPVKVELLPDGSARVTEHDGDQFAVARDGTIRALTRNASLGAPAGGPPAHAYGANRGGEHVYFGRGYVQLTWWSNYVNAGIALRRGLDLLLDPELVKDPDVAYQIMSLGMRTGTIFANGHSFDDYFNDRKTDYVAARHMVNGHDHAQDIARIAEGFDGILISACAKAASEDLLRRLQFTPLPIPGDVP